MGREVDPYNPSVNQFGEFLFFFLHNKNFSLLLLRDIIQLFLLPQNRYLK